MATNWGDAFLQTYMQSQAQQAEQKRQVQGFMFQNFWNQAKMQQEQQQAAAALQQKTLYEQGLLGARQQEAGAAAKRDEAATAEHTANILKQGGQEVQPQPLDNPVGLPGGPALAQHDPATMAPAELPASATTMQPLQAPPPPNSIALGDKVIHIPTAAELAAAAQQQQTTALQGALDRGEITPEQHKAITAMLGVKNAVGGNLNEAELGAVGLGKPSTKAGDEPLGTQADSINQMTLDRLKALDPTVTEVPPHLRVTPQTTKTQYDIMHQNLQGVENAKAALANAKNAQEDRAARLALQQAMLGLQQGREQDRVASENEKYIGPARDAVQFARDYIGSGHYTGAGDEQLQERFFDAVKPSSGFRMTKAMMDLQQKLQSVENRGRALWANVTGGTLYSDQLRREIADQIEAAHQMKAGGLASKGKAAPTAAPAAAPAATPGQRPPLSSFGR